MPTTSPTQAPIAWRIDGAADDLAKAEGMLRSLTQPSTSYPDFIRVFPDGHEVRLREDHRLDDYFEEVNVLRGKFRDRDVLWLIFRRRPNAPRYWKDVMVSILTMLHNHFADFTFSRDTPPVAITAPSATH